MRAKSLLRRKDPEAKRFTRDEVKKLKITSEFSNPSLVPLEYKLKKLIDFMLHFCLFKPGLKKNQCRLYGHKTLEKVSDISTISRCLECGDSVTQFKQLRKASLVWKIEKVYLAFLIHITKTLPLNVKGSVFLRLDFPARDQLSFIYSTIFSGDRTYMPILLRR